MDEMAQAGTSTTTNRPRGTPLAMSGDEFRRLGYALVDQIAGLLDSLPQRPVTPGESPEQIRALIAQSRDLPELGRPAEALLQEATELLLDHSLFNSHPRFWGYVTAGPAPLGVLAELLAAGVNPNVGAWKLSPIATEIELQVVRWIAQLIGYSAGAGGLLVSGGNLANFVGVLAARRAKAAWDTRQEGMHSPHASRLRLYTSTETHTWIHKAADLFGLGLDAICWVPVDRQHRMQFEALRSSIETDRKEGYRPFLVVGNAGTVSTGAVDPLSEIAALCSEYDLWFHVDGAYGGMAACAPGADPRLSGLAEADSVAIDPHKWLYAPLEAGCVLVRRPSILFETFSHHPSYYHFETDTTNFYELGLQNSRGFRALKIWLQMQQAGRQGYLEMMGEDIRLAREFFEWAGNVPDLQVLTHNLSITTFRYRPAALAGREQEPEIRGYLDDLNQQLLTRLEAGGEAFVSNAVVDGGFALRLCIVNFRSTQEDIRALPEIICRFGQQLDQRLRGR